MTHVARHTRGDFRKRPPQLVNPRTLWMRLIGFAGHAGAISGIADFSRDLGLAKHAAFPIEGASAQGAARGFLEFANAYIGAPNIERRALLAPGLSAAGQVLDALLHEDRTRAAQSTWAGRD